MPSLTKLFRQNNDQPLIDACARGDLDTVQMLVLNGADIRAQYCAPIRQAIIHNRTVVFRYLASLPEFDADINHCHLAAEHGSVRIFQYYLKYTDIKTDTDVKPDIYEVIKSDNIGILDVLLQHTNKSEHKDILLDCVYTDSVQCFRYLFALYGFPDEITKEKIMYGVFDKHALKIIDYLIDIKQITELDEHTCSIVHSYTVLKFLLKKGLPIHFKFNILGYSLKILKIYTSLGYTIHWSNINQKSLNRYHSKGDKYFMYLLHNTYLGSQAYAVRIILNTAWEFVLPKTFICAMNKLCNDNIKLSIELVIIQLFQKYAMSSKGNTLIMAAIKSNLLDNIPQELLDSCVSDSIHTRNLDNVKYFVALGGHIPEKIDVDIMLGYTIGPNIPLLEYLHSNGFVFQESYMRVVSLSARFHSELLFLIDVGYVFMNAYNEILRKIVSTKIFKRLIDLGCDTSQLLRQLAKRDKTMLQYAVTQCRIDINSCGMDPLFVATKYDNTALFDELIRLGLIITDEQKLILHIWQHSSAEFINSYKGNLALASIQVMPIHISNLNTSSLNIFVENNHHILDAVMKERITYIAIQNEDSYLLKKMIMLGVDVTEFIPTIANSFYADSMVKYFRSLGIKYSDLVNECKQKSLDSIIREIYELPNKSRFAMCEGLRDIMYKSPTVHRGLLEYSGLQRDYDRFWDARKINICKTHMSDIDIICCA